MWILDRYLLRQFLKTFLICLISLTGLFIVIHAFTNLDEFLRCAEKRGGLAAMMGSYYAYQSILFFDQTAALLTLVSAMFTAAWIQRHNELTALMAAGISRVRVVAPVLGAAILILVLAAVNREVTIPRYRAEMVRLPRELAGSVARELRFCYDNHDVLIRSRGGTYADQQKIDRPDFLLPLALTDYGTQLLAAEAVYQAPEGNRPGGYLLRGVEQPKDLDRQPSLKLHGQPVIITPRDAPDWLKPGECFVASDLSFEELTESDGFRQLASLGQLIRRLRSRSTDYDADVRVAIHARMVQPLLDVTLLLLGLPLVLARESRNVFLAIGLCALVVAVFMMVEIGFHYLGSVSMLSPVLAAWAPLILFAPAAVWSAESMWE